MQPEVDRIGQDHGQQQRAVCRRLMMLQMGKVVSEPGPAIHFQEQVGDFDVRQEGVGLPHQGLGCFRNRVRQGRNLENPFRNRRIGQLVPGGERIDFFEFLPQEGFTLGPIPVETSAKLRIMVTQKPQVIEIFGPGQRCGLADALGETFPGNDLLDRGKRIEARFFRFDQRLANLGIKPDLFIDGFARLLKGGFI
jgi:hypothetical protein